MAKNKKEAPSPQHMLAEWHPELVLGWEPDQYGEARYPAGTGSTPGGQKRADLVCLPRNAIDAHTAIIAQSGYGKSFLLGRLLEEILLKTRATCTILDPNSDFRRFVDIEPSLWNQSRQRGSLPTESTMEEFAAPWRVVQQTLITGDPSAVGGHVQQPKLWWPTLPVTLWTEGLDRILLLDVVQLHEFVGWLVAQGVLIDPVERADQLIEARRANVDADKHLQRQVEDIALVLERRKPGATLDIDRVKSAVSRVAEVRPEARDYYVRYHGQLRDKKILAGTENDAELGLPPTRRVCVVDLPSFDSPDRELVVFAMLDRIWRRARADWKRAQSSDKSKDDRTPHFVVIDEAHNLIPAEPHGHAARAIADKIRTIAAEGRKFGVFLVMVSQRPDKIHPAVLSECENFALMHLSAPAATTLGSVLGVTDGDAKKLIEELPVLKPGQGFCIGRWAPGIKMMKYCCCPRRTVEGGRSLQKNYWADYDPAVLAARNVVG